MSEDRLSPLSSVAKLLLRAGGVACVLGLFVVILSVVLQLVWGYGEVVLRLVAGWFFFLRENLTKLDIDPGIWIPGLLALLIAIFVAHFFLRGWAKRRNRKWSPAGTLALALMVPLFFVISFLVPGVILQVNELAKVKWAHRGASIGETLQRQEILSLQGLLLESAVSQDETGGRFPAALTELDEMKPRAFRKRLAYSSNPTAPPEFPIYLGSGFTLDSDPQLPLLISPSFVIPEGECRYVVTIGGERIKIPADEADAWIQRSLDARPPADAR